jgi:hypothetical protein
MERSKSERHELMVMMMMMREALCDREAKRAEERMVKWWGKGEESKKEIFAPLEALPCCRRGS